MLFVGVASWIIQDGNYADFRAGESGRFALEFYPHSLKPAQTQEAFFEHIRASRYRICGQVVYLNRSVWVIDFGVMVYENREPPAFARNGGWVVGEIDLGVDPFFYSAELYSLPNMPALQYDWRIKTILLETTPWLSRKDQIGSTVLTRDEKQESFVEVSETDAWNDDNGNGHYILECHRIG